MKKVVILILFFNLSFSQNYEKEKIKLVKYKSIEIKNFEGYKSYWSEKKILKNGLIYQNENYYKGKLRSRQNYVYDNNGNEVFEIQNYNPNDSKTNDTISKQKLTYNSENVIVQREYNYDVIEKYSDFNNDGKPGLKEVFSTKNDTLIFLPFKEIFTYDSKGNIIKEVIYQISYSKETNSKKKILEIETNEYKYDAFNNVIEIMRKQEPKIEFPILMIGGRPIYEIEKFRYIYNQDNLWTKMFLIVNEKEILIKKRKFKK